MIAEERLYLRLRNGGYIASLSTPFYTLLKAPMNICILYDSLMKSTASRNGIVAGIKFVGCIAVMTCMNDGRRSCPKMM